MPGGFFTAEPPGKPTTKKSPGPNVFTDEFYQYFKGGGTLNLIISSVQFSSVAQLCLTLCDPMSYSMPGLPVQHHSQNLPKLMSIESVMPSNHLILIITF